MSLKNWTNCVNGAPVLGLFLLALAGTTTAFTNRINQAGHGAVSVTYTANTNAYYTFHASTNLPAVFKAEAMALGVNGTGSFLRSTTNAKIEFYRVEESPLPLRLDNLAGFDRDGDGIDDYYELTHPPLNPLNPADAGPYLAQYYAALPLYAYFATDSSSVSALLPVAVLPFYLTKPFVGTVRYQVSGTTIAGTDFQPLVGWVLVTGKNGSIAISLINTPQIESARSLVVTLQMETNKGSYTLSKPTAHRLDLIEGDSGLYAGAMGFTNGVFFGPQPLVIAVRSLAGNAGTAYFDTSGCTFFSHPFSIPIEFTGVNGQFQFKSPATGSTYSTNLARTLNWSLAVAATTFTNNLLQAPFTLSVDGITSGSATLLAKGTILLGLIGK